MNLKKMAIPAVLGTVAFALAFFILAGGAEPPKRTVVQLLSDKNPGDVIAPGDVRLVRIEAQYTRQAALERLEDAVGKTVLVPRQRGDILLKTDVGDGLPVHENARLMGVKVSIDDAIAGLLKPGDRVTLIASIPLESEGSIFLGGQGGYTKAFLDGLRVVYVPEALAPVEPVAEQPQQEGFVAVAIQRQQAQEGVVVLEVPTEPVPVVYALPKEETMKLEHSSGITESLSAALEEVEYEYEMKLISPVEFIAALKAAGARFTLALIPPGQEGGEFSQGSAGVLLGSYVPESVRAAMPRTVIVPGGGQ